MPAKRYLALSRALAVTSALCFAAAPRSAVAQAAAAPAADTTTTTTATTTTTTTAPAAFGISDIPAGDQATVLSPFVVDASEDKGSYKANSTLASTRVRTDLGDVASAISVVTAQFLQDTGAKNSQDLLVYTPNTEVAGLQGNFSGQAGQPQYTEQLANPSATTRVRGLDTADNTRDYFLTDVPWDGFDTGRIDLQRGPNSILFGVGSPAGIINNSINGAEFTDAKEFENRIGSYGSLRDSADLNYVLIPNELAVRVSWVEDDEKYQQQPAFNDTQRYFGALRWDPVLFGKDNHTSLRANFEKGDVSSNNPRSLPPVDELTPWFATTNAYGNMPLNKLTVNQWAIGNGTNGLGDNNSTSAADSPYESGHFTRGRTYWPDVLSVYNGANSSTGAIPPTSAAPTNEFTDMIATTYAMNSSGIPDTGAIGDLPFYRPLGVPPTSVYTQYAPVAIPGGGFYTDKPITDPSIFNFYDHLLDGPNKKEWQNWRVGDVDLSQTFWHDRLAFDLTYDAQSYTSGSQSALQAEEYSISVDVNATNADGSANPNLGRPFVANSYWASDTATTINREALRFETTLELRAEDFLGKGLVSEIIGRHVFTGLLDEDRKDSSQLNWSAYATDANYPALVGPPNIITLDSLTTYRQMDFINYLGPSLLGASSAAGANISAVTNLIIPSSQGGVEYYNSNWNKPTNPTDPNYVNPGAPFTYISHTSGVSVTGTQSDNPANYIGWQTAPVNFLSATNPQQFPDLITSAEKTKYTDVNQGFTWQGFLFDGDLVPTVGWRKDSVTNYANAGPQNTVSGLISPDFSIDPTSRTSASGTSKSYGIVYHFPKFLTQALPWGTTFSLFYDKSQNFKADTPRQNLFGDVIANPSGKTKEYGFTVSTLNDKLSLKVDWYHTTEDNATLDQSNGNSIGGLGSSGYFMWAAPTWGMSYAAQIQDGLQGINPNNGGNWNYANADGVPGASAGPGSAAFDNAPETALEKQIVNAWLNFPLPASFFSYYGIHPLPINPAAGLASGNIRDDFGPGYTESINIGGEQWTGSSNAVTTVATVSTGNEFELTAQPTKNWNLTANYSRTFATHTDVDSSTTAFMASQFAFFSGVGGQLRLWGGGVGNAIGPMWIQNIYNPYLVEVHTEGQSSPEVAPWRFNLATTYTFDRGPAKGWFVGGADRMEAGKVVGYPYSATLGFLDTAHPFIGPTDTHVDAWFGYSRRVFANKVNWRIQANLRNVGEKAHLVLDSVEPDGSIGLERIQDGMTWQLTNTFDF
jgi:hypothetical protein